MDEFEVMTSPSNFRLEIFVMAKFVSNICIHIFKSHYLHMFHSNLLQHLGPMDGNLLFIFNHLSAASKVHNFQMRRARLREGLGYLLQNLQGLHEKHFLWYINHEKDIKLMTQVPLVGIIYILQFTVD